MAKTEAGKSDMPARRAAFREAARELIAAIGATSTDWKPPRQVPAYTYFFGSKDQLNVVVFDEKKKANIDLGLAYALAHVGDRSLNLLIPKDFEESTQQRLVGLSTDVRLYTYEGQKARPSECRKLTLADLAKLEEKASIRGGEHNLGNRQEWVQDLIDWADQLAPALVQANRNSYRAWHCLGRQLLKLKTTSKGIDVLAGVNYTKPTGTQSSPITLHLTKPMTVEESWRVKEAVLRGIINRRAGGDDSRAHLEHQMQAVLMAEPETLTGSKKIELRREVPAKRPGGGTGFIDFVFVDSRGVLHLVETKIGEDPMLVLQGLDYWLWAQVNLKLLEKELKIKNIRDVQIDFALGEKDGTLVAPSAAVLRTDAPAQLQQLRADIPWRIARVTGWLREDPAVRQLQVREVPDLEFMTGKSAKKSK